MIVSYNGLVIRKIGYGENRLVVSIYSEQEGMRTFMVRVPSKPGGKFRPSFFFPLSQIEFSFDRKPGDSDVMPYLRDVKFSYVYRNLYSDVHKSSMAIFMAEVMGRCITQSEADPRFFSRLVSALQQLDLQETGYADFHLFFLLEMASLMGVYPQGKKRSSDVFFDLREGCFLSDRPAHSAFVEGLVVSDLAALIERRGRDGIFPAEGFFGRKRRWVLLSVLTEYCRIQAGISGSFHSLEVLHSLYAG